MAGPTHKFQLGSESVPRKDRHVSWQSGDSCPVLVGHRRCGNSGNEVQLVEWQCVRRRKHRYPKSLVKNLGVQDLSFSPDAISPIALLRRNPVVWAALSGRPADAHAKSHSANASTEVVAWDTEGLRFLHAATPESERRGCELFREAAAKGYAGSEYRLGYGYETGRGVVQNFSTANEWYEKAANQGYVDAQYKLGHTASGSDEACRSTWPRPSSGTRKPLVTVTARPSRMSDECTPSGRV
jgi:hypothetical protein